MFRIIFVLDIFDRRVVHAVRGERDRYQPIHKFSKICNTSDPLEIIKALRPREVYIADLNRLQGMGDNFEIIRRISRLCSSMVDLGAASLQDVKNGLNIASNVVLGTETSTLNLIGEASQHYPGSINVSIDIKNGKVLTRDKKLEIDPLELIDILNNYQIKDLIILELSRVGTERGINREFLEKAAINSDHDLLLGGGIRDLEDLLLLEGLGLKGALVATAIHTGKIPIGMIQQGRNVKS